MTIAGKLLMHWLLCVLLVFAASGWTRADLVISPSYQQLINISRSAFPPREGHALVMVGATAWLTGGRQGLSVFDDVFTSAAIDSGLWVQVAVAAKYPARHGHVSVSDGRAVWLLGGTLATGTAGNDVWRSAKGAAWSCVTAAAAWSPRTRMSGAFFASQLVIVGGWVPSTNGTGGTFSNDVWLSADGGARWTPSAPVPWAARADAALLVLGQALVLTGGVAAAAGPVGRPTTFNDVWVASVPLTWTTVTSAAAFAPRYGLAACVVQGIMVVSGGTVCPPATECGAVGDLVRPVRFHSPIRVSVSNWL